MFALDGSLSRIEAAESDVLDLFVSPPIPINLTGNRLEPRSAQICAVKRDSLVQVYAVLAAEHGRNFVYAAPGSGDSETSYTATLDQALQFVRSMGFAPERVDLSFSPAMRAVVVRNYKIFKFPGQGDQAVANSSRLAFQLALEDSVAVASIPELPKASPGPAASPVVPAAAGPVPSAATCASQSMPDGQRQELYSISDLIVKFASEMTTLRVERDSLAVKVEGLEGELAGARRELARLARERDEARREHQELSAGQERLAETAVEAEKELARAKKAVVAAQKEAASAKEEAAGAQKWRSEAQVALVRAQEDIVRYQVTLGKAQEVVSKAREEAAKAKDEAAKANEVAAKAQAEAAAAKAETANWKAEATNAKAEAASIMAEATSAKAEAASAKAEATSAKAEAASAKAEAASAKAEVTNAMAEVTNAMAEAASAKTEAASAKAEAASAKTEAASAKTEAASAKTQAASAKAEVTSAKADAANAQSEAAHGKAELAMNLESAAELAEELVVVTAPVVAVDANAEAAPKTEPLVQDHIAAVARLGDQDIAPLSFGSEEALAGAAGQAGRELEPAVTAKERVLAAKAPDVTMEQRVMESPVTPPEIVPGPSTVAISSSTDVEAAIAMLTAPVLNTDPFAGFGSADDRFFSGSETSGEYTPFVPKTELTVIEYGSPDDFLELQKSYNVAQVALAGKATESCEGYICCLTIQGQLQVFAALYGLKSGKINVYAPQSQPADQEGMAAAVAGAMLFHEQLGLLLEPLDLGSPTQRLQVVSGCPVLKARAERGGSQAGPVRGQGARLKEAV